MYFHSSTIILGSGTAARPKGASLLPGLFFPLFLLFVAGCAGSHLAHIREKMIHAPFRVQIAGVPEYIQTEFQCGPAALAMALTWSGIPAAPAALVSEVYSPALKGSLQPALVGAARRWGRLAYPISGTEALLKEVAAGHPVIVLENLGLSWYPEWHYSVVTGYDLSEDFITLHSGKKEPEDLPFRVFEHVWGRAKRWGLVVLKPGDLPATAEERPYLFAVLGLEKARQWQGAAAAYRAGLRKWPGSLPALMGLGNSYYALRDLPRAEQSFQKAGRLHPTDGAAFNNLAQVLWEQGRRKEALDAAQKAVSLGGPLVNTYRQTLKEIQSGKP